jgi:hypothetical protein
MQSLCCDNGAAAHFEQHERERDLRRPAHAGRPQQPGQPRRPGRQAEDYPSVSCTGSPQQSGDLLLRRKTRRAHASDFTHWRNLAPSIRNSPEQVWKGEEFRISDGRPPQSLFGAMLSLYSAVSGFASTPQGQFGCYCAPPAPILPHNMTCTRALLLLSSPHAISPPIGFGPMTAKDAASFQRSCCRWQLPPVLGPPHPRWVSPDVLRRHHCSHG